MSNFNSNDIKKAEEIIAAGLKKAAESLSFFMKEKIRLQETDFTISDKFNGETSVDAQAAYVLSTELRGSLKGVCYLVFTEEESNELCRVALPPQIFNDNKKLDGMKEPLLLEIDNILSASVITQLANELQAKVYGDVPVMHKMNSSELSALISKQLLPDKLIMGFQTEFISTKTHFHPSFFWILEPDFMQSVQNSLLTQN